MPPILEAVSLSALVWSVVIILIMYAGFKILSGIGKKEKGAKVIDMKTEVDLTEDFYTEQKINQ